MITETVLEDDRWQLAGLARLAENAVQATLAHLNLAIPDLEICLLGCDDARIAVLNGDFRDKPTPTNVLSWPATDLAADDDGGAPNLPQRDAQDFDPSGAIELGDIAIAYETCLREAADQGKTMEQHTSHLIVHGVLHLLGYDHIRDKDATLMEDNERVILGKLGYPDPYRDNATRI